MSKKRSFSLIELLVSLGLMTLLITALFSWHRHTTKAQGEIEKLKEPLLERRYVWQRLEQMLPHAQTPFFTDEGLVFRFDRGVSNTPELSGTVLAKLYHDEQAQALCIGIWPDPQKELTRSPSQTLVLMENIDKLSFDFFAPPKPKPLKVDPKEVGDTTPDEGWHTHWLASYNTTPALIEMHLSRDGDTHTLYFDLDHAIVHPKESA